MVSSGGMYTERFDLDRLEMDPEHYDGVRAYARAKRAQVVLAREWSRRWSACGVASYAMHPGWVDTPGLASGLPSFTYLGPLLRRPEEGADTAVWLAAGAARPSAAARVAQLLVDRGRVLARPTPPRRVLLALDKTPRWARGRRPPACGIGAPHTPGSGAIGDER